MALVAAIAVLVAAAGGAWGRPIDPSIDPPGQPFCYYSRPATVLGVADGPEGTQVTAEGWLWTGYAEMMFFMGPDLQPVRQRIRTLMDGHLPVVQYRVKRGNVVADFTMFGATLDGKPESNLINFVRVELRNAGQRQETAQFAVAVRANGPFCCPWMKRLANLMRAVYRLGPYFAARDEQLIYVFPTQPKPKLFVAPGVQGAGPIKAKDEGITERVPVLMVVYQVPLRPGQKVALDFKMPYVPVALADREQCRAIRDASFDEYLKRTVRWWRDYLAQGTQIELPEKKVVDTYLASIMYDSIARDKVGDLYIPKVNEFQYDGFWVRDGAYIVSAFDTCGRHKWAEQGLEVYLKQQRKDGIMYQPPQLDGFGQTLWVFGEHWRLTRDREWARRVYPALVKHVRGVFEKCKSDPLGLIPKAPPYDNEAINGHYTGHSLWLGAGMRDVIAIARALGHKDDAAEFQRLYEEYWKRFLRELDKVTAKTGGYVPPGLDAGPGCDWGNLLLTYPRGGDPALGNFYPTDPRVTATVDAVREKKYAEGIMTYGPGLKVGGLHLYLTMKVTENLVAQNRQRETLEDFYSILVHTTATHGGFEWGIRPWDNRDPGGNLPPHGWFAAKYMLLLRDMLLREWGGDLHLLTVLSPQWVKPGATVAIRRAPTDFGQVTVEAKMAADSMQVSIDGRWWQVPRRLVVHVPWFMRATAATADGKAVAVEKAPFGQGQVVVVPAGTKKVVVRWRKVEDVAMSYEAAVEAWKAENRRHFEEFVAKGGEPEPLWPEREIVMTRQARMEQWKAHGIAVGCNATASHSEGGHPPEMAVDGITTRESYWGATPYPAWWQVDLGEAKWIDRVRVITYWGQGRYYQYKVLVSEDGKKWTVVADMSENTKPATAQGVMHMFKPVKARYVRVEMLKNSANPGVHLVEVMVFSVPEAPVVPGPEQGAEAWSAEEQTGSKPVEMKQWGFVGSERILIDGRKVKRRGEKVRLVFRAAKSGKITIGNVTIAEADSKAVMDARAGTMTPVTFGRSGTVELSGGKQVRSDWIKFRIEPGKSYLVTFDVLTAGATTLWPDEKTKRWETQWPGASRAGRWSELPCSGTYNLYFLEAIETAE